MALMDILKGVGGFAAGGLGGLAASQAGSGGISDFLFGSDMKKVPTMTGGQSNLLEELLGMLSGQGQLGQGYGQGLSNLQEMLDPSSAAYQRFEAPYMQKFQQETIPGIAERFAGVSPMGGGLSSSGFGQSLSAAGGQLQTQLAGMKSNLQRQAIQDILNQYQQMSGSALGQRPFGYQQPTQGFLSQFLGNAAQAAPQAAQMMMGG